MTEQIKDGGPAFPGTLRDHFAILATEKDLIAYENRYIGDDSRMHVRTRAQARYAFADAMLKAREVGHD